MPASVKPRSSLRPQRILVYVNAVVRHGSIRKAAESLHIASSALNRRILDLEEEIGVPLFERLPRGVRLTAAGEVYVDYVQRALADIELVSSQIERLRGLVRGRVRIAATESVAVHLLPKAIAQFQTRHPGVYFNVTIVGAGHLVESLASDAVDLILTHDLYNRTDLTVLHTASQPFCALVAKEHPLAARKSVRLHECLAYPIALADETLAGRVLIDRALHKTSFMIEPALVSNSIEVMKVFARESKGVCFQFKVGAAPDAEMAAVPLKDPALGEGHLFLAMRRGRSLPSAAAAFSEHLTAALQALS